METAAILEDTITCCICFNVYQDPHALPCLHTLCKPCLDQLVVRGKVECPECREMTDVNKIRKDFRIQNLINDQKNTEGAKEENSTVCGMCNDKDKCLVSHCHECQHYMCAGCEKGHKGMRVCKGHTVKPLIDVVNIAKSKLEEGVAQWREEKAVISAKAAKVEDFIKGIQNHRDRQIVETIKHFDKLKNELERQSNSLIKDIRDENELAITELRNNKEVYNQLTVEIDTKLETLREIINKKDLITFNKMGNDVDKSLQAEIDSIRDRVGQFVLEASSPIEVVTDDTKQMDPGIHINRLLTGKNVRSLATDYTKLARYRYMLDNVKTLEGIESIYKVKVINNNLWIAASNDGILIYNKHLEFIKHLRNDNYNRVTGISEWGQDILVSCGDHHGLHLIEQSGKYLKKIAGGDFTDVCSSDRKVFVYDMSRKQVIIYVHENNEWKEIKEINIHDGTTLHTKISVYHGKILISLSNNDHIMQYNLQGDFELTLGSPGSQTGNLNQPILCSVDKHGNFLVADLNNHPLQVFLSRSPTLHTVNLPRLRNSLTPRDAVVDGNCDNIWAVIVGGEKHPQLLRYSRTLACRLDENAGIILLFVCITVIIIKVIDWWQECWLSRKL